VLPVLYWLVKTDSGDDDDDDIDSEDNGYDSDKDKNFIIIIIIIIITVGIASVTADSLECPVWGWGTPFPPCPFTSPSFAPFYFFCWL